MSRTFLKLHINNSLILDNLPYDGIILGCQLPVNLPQVVGSDHLDLGDNVMHVAKVNTVLKHVYLYFR